MTKFNDKEDSRIIIHENNGTEIRFITNDEVVFRHLTEDEKKMIFDYLKKDLGV